MAVYTVFEHPVRGTDRTVFVKEGFSSAAFVFSVLWALWHRMWIVSASLLAIMALVWLGSQYLGLQDAPVSVLNLGIGLVFGFEAQDLRAASLRKAGYQEAGLVMAGSLEEAELKHAYALPHIGIEPVPQRTMMQPPADTLGLFGNV